ncbi:14-3-3-like protein GF14 epsilon [Tritrichomonas foetus]|uniref:14-3-3-like protein GF14 epsilon n=1 Tax=Tritrichomonas foetus TaxID=1144522 RepID=A0A1J4JLG5_9EUKA|nr:14-3-3-like protein GF14 epsilon [Tritrichomonas foetus]|eukprot:OHS99521.1 14-3-3-like protein GF14 epsilon [Tritrichomonas foetus]
MSNERDMMIFMAQSCLKMKRYEDSIKFIKDAILIDAKLDEKERNLFSLAYKKSVDNRRNVLQFIATVLALQQKKECKEKVDKLNSYQNRLYNELSTLSYECIDYIDRFIFKNVENTDEKIFFLKLKADHYRYMAESLPESERWQSSSAAHQSYEESIKMAKSSLSPTNPVYINTILNYSVFLHEILKRYDDALTISEDFLEKLDEIIQSIPDSLTNEMKSIVKRIKGNVDMWKKMQNGDE